MNSFACTVCGEQGHSSRRCTALWQPLQPGFFAPSGGARYTEDDDDEHCKFAGTVGGVDSTPNKCLSLSLRSVIPLPIRYGMEKKVVDMVGSLQQNKQRSLRFSIS